MKIILSDNTVIAIREDDFTLATTDTDVSIMSWSGDEPSVGDVLSNNTFVSPWDAMADDAKLVLIRSRRSPLLTNTDYMVSRHSEQESRCIPTTLALTQYNELLAYRQALRDFTDTVNLNVADFNAITWPNVPSFI